jgi:hypothetical protein
MKEKLDDIIRLWAYAVQEISDMNALLSHETINKQFYRRIILRNTLSIIDTYIFICRELVCFKNIIDKNASQLSWKEQSLLVELKVGLDSKGEVKTTDNFQSFIPALRFSLITFSKVFGSPTPDFTNHQFENVQAFVKRRNQVTHPKNYNDTIITDKEIVNLIPAFQWFMDTHSSASVGFHSWLEDVYPTL